MSDARAPRLTPALVAASVDLANVLARENAALQMLDMPRAAAMLAEKQKAASAFLAAQSGRGAPPLAMSHGQREAAMAAATRLRDLAEDNRRLLERAMLVQGRVIGTIAKAVPRKLAEQASRYAAGGTAARPARMPAFAVSARI